MTARQSDPALQQDRLPAHGKAQIRVELVGPGRTLAVHKAGQFVVIRRPFRESEPYGPVDQRTEAIDMLIFDRLQLMSHGLESSGAGSHVSSDSDQSPIKGP